MGDVLMQSFIANFYCSKDIDIERFVKDKAIIFEKLGKARTYFVVDVEAFNSEVKILGFFSLAISILDVPKELSNRSRKILDGLSAKKYGEIVNKIPSILIGQFGKNDLYCRELSGEELFELCLNKIYEGQKIFGGRIIMVECKPVPKLIDFYKREGFVLTSNEVNDGNFMMLHRVLQEEEIVLRDD